MSGCYMPTKIFWGRDCLIENKELLKPLGKKAFIVTGKSSARNGALSDTVSALGELGIKYAVFDQTEENPSVECVRKAAEIGRHEGCDFVVAIGGGSPLDAGKGVAVLLKNPEKDGFDLYGSEKLDAVPVIAVPTTAGTGSEVTAVFVLTNHRIKTKASTPQRVYPKLAFLDGKYLRNMPDEVMINTVCDSLAHSIESYLSPMADFFSERAAEGAFEAFCGVKHKLLSKSFDDGTLDNLLLISTLSGIAINQTGTSLPHYLGYALTYYKGIPHGRASGILLYEYMFRIKNKHKVKIIIQKLGFGSLEEFGAFMKKILRFGEDITETEFKLFAELAMKKPEKLKTFPETATYELLEGIYLCTYKNFR